MEKKRNKRAATAATAAVLILALGLAGTFAKFVGDDSEGDIEGEVKTAVRLHDDYDSTQKTKVRDRDIYAENTGDTSLYIRMKLTEYLEIGNRSVIGGAKKNDRETWTTHLPSAADSAQCTKAFHDYFAWKMGNTDPVPYASNVKNWHTNKDAAKVQDKKSGKASIVTMQEYMKAKDDAKPSECWIIDKDGYAYWHTQLPKDTATGLLLNSIEITGDMDDDYYYGLHAYLEAVTEGDLT